jgi:hypothetical protein
MVSVAASQGFARKSIEITEIADLFFIKSQYGHFLFRCSALDFFSKKIQILSKNVLFKRRFSNLSK